MFDTFYGCGLANVADLLVRRPPLGGLIAHVQDLFDEDWMTCDRSRSDLRTFV
jgi:hypothetical protein